MLAATLLFMTGCSGPYSTLDPAGPAASSVAALWWGMFIVASLVLIVVCALWWYAMRRKALNISDEEAQKLQNQWVIGGGIALPTVAITVLLAFGIPIGHNMLPLPLEDGEVTRIEIEAHQWFWRVSYPEEGFELIDQIYIPVDTPVDFYISSEDVIHSFWVPRLGGKIDAIPGRTNVLRLSADEAGTYGGQCAEFCGRGHAFMQFEVTALAAEDYENWLLQMEAENNE
ncbi:cytochrome c oxidase subunit II [Aliidiomarina minuta]|uniref:cytochrome-c oxidase n=1 Tax=Aliidiomarina minuta TaxID=880057 RepID=A0A432WAG3_9GAMM|nr:cytochrome c oxidase subunit II [Aliidiomarina minuta]